MKKSISIHKYLFSTITSRKAVEVIKSEIPLVSNTAVTFDFSNIDFISRAFADELIHFIADKGISADFKNANAVITEMLTVVQKNRGKRNSSFHHIAITPFKDKKELSNFLTSL